MKSLFRVEELEIDEEILEIQHQDEKDSGPKKEPPKQQHLQPPSLEVSPRRNKGQLEKMRKQAEAVVIRESSGEEEDTIKEGVIEKGKEVKDKVKKGESREEQKDKESQKPHRSRRRRRRHHTSEESESSRLSTKSSSSSRSKTRSNRRRNKKDSSCYYCDRLCSFHRRSEMSIVPPNLHTETAAKRVDEATQVGDPNVRFAEHYMFDPTKDMLFQNAWSSSTAAVATSNGFTIRGRAGPPPTMALTELMKTQLDLTEGFLQAQRKLYISYCENLQLSIQEQHRANRQKDEKVSN